MILWNKETIIEDGAHLNGNSIKLYLSSQGNQVDNQTWFDATLVKRFNECNREVTIHRPNVSTHQSSAFVKAGNK